MALIQIQTNGCESLADRDIFKACAYVVKVDATPLNSSLDT